MVDSAKVLLLSAAPGQPTAAASDVLGGLAELGWDVLLLAPALGRPTCRSLSAGGVVQLVPVPADLLDRPPLWSGHLAHPLAFPDRASVAHAGLLATYRQLDLETRRDRLGRRPLLRVGGDRLAAYWRRARARQYRSLTAAGDLGTAREPEVRTPATLRKLPELEVAFDAPVRAFSPDAIVSLDDLAGAVAHSVRHRVGAPGRRPLVFGCAELDTLGLSGIDRLLRAAVGPERAPSTGADLDRLLQQLTAGDWPDLAELGAACRFLTGRADSRHRRGDTNLALSDLGRAAALLFHRTLHFDSGSSPLAAEPDAYLAPWTGSELVSEAAVRRASGWRPPVPGPVAPSRVAVVAYKNFNFVPQVERAAAELGLSVTRVDLADLRSRWPQAVTDLVALRRRDEPASETEWGRELQDLLAGHDTVWAEWALASAVAVTTLAPSWQRLVLRLHKFEAWTPFPHLIDWSAVDDAVFVGPHIRDLVLPRLRGFDAATTRVHILPVGIDTARYPLGKDLGASRVLALVGWSAPAKDAVWALDLLARLRADDPSFRLLLVGAEPDAGGPAGVRRYAADVRERAACTDVRDAVEFVPFTSDVPGLLRRVGVSLSSSTNESLHVGVIEGAASAAVPVVRDWPMVAAFDGPRRIFPPEWVVADVESARRRILDATVDTERFAAVGSAAAAEAAARFDDAVVREQLRAVLLGG